MTKILVFSSAFLFASLCFADISVNVRVQTDLDCVVSGNDLGKKHYDVIIPVKIYEKQDGSLWGTGAFSYDDFSKRINLYI